MLKKIYISLLVVNLVLLNFAVSYLVYAKFFSQEQKEVGVETIDLREFVSGKENVVVEDKCGDECRAYVDEKVSGLESLVLQLPKDDTTDVVVTTPISTSKKTKTVSYLPISF